MFNMFLIFASFILQVVRTQEIEYCSNSSWIITQNNITIDYAENCTSNPIFNDLTLTINCTSTNFNWVHVIFDQTLKLNELITNCSALSINSIDITITLISANLDISYSAPLLLSTYFISLNAKTISLIGDFQGPNYSLYLNGSTSINNQIFSGQQLFAISNSTILISNSSIIVTMQSCNNTFGYQNINSKSYELYQEIKQVLHRFTNNTFYNFTKLQTLFIASNFTTVLLGSIVTLDNTYYSAGQIAIIAQNQVIIDTNSILNLTGTGCIVNQGNGHGPAFYSPYINCYPNGGTNGGYGGVGEGLTYETTTDCLLLTNSTRYMFNLYPYGYTFDGLLQGSGGSSLNFDQISTNHGFGGGALLFFSQVITLNGQILANGIDGVFLKNTTQIKNSIGAGSGGTLAFYYSKFFGGNSSNITAIGGSSPSDLVGEGGGGLIKFKQLQDWSNIIQFNTSYNMSYSGSIYVNAGYRDIYPQKKETVNFLAEDGTILYSWCPPFQETAQNLSCKNCSQQYYKLWWGGQCVPCPKSSTVSSKNTQPSSSNSGVTMNSNQFCPSNELCLNNQKCCLIDSFSDNLLQNTGYQLFAFCIMILIGFIIRRSYRKRESCSTEKNFDFELATSEITQETIISESLMENPIFQFGDLLYHAHRIHVIGCNTYQSPWMIHSEPTLEIEHAVVKEEYYKFSSRFNKIAQWKTSEYILMNIFAILYYPIYWVMQTRYKKKKFQALNSYLTKNEICKFWRTNPADQSFIRLKMTKSADYTLLYIDVFNYKNSDLKYIFLTCPYIIYLSGEGNFLRPFYVCESDQFLASLFFAINKKLDGGLGTRQKIMNCLVQKEIREQNSKEIRRFLKRINKVSMTLDYGATSEDFTYNFKELFKILDKWNQIFFKLHNVKIELLVCQTPYEQHQSSIITIIEYKSDHKINKFLEDIHKSVNYNKLLDVKFGLFIFNTEQDPQDIDEQLQNQKFSFYENEEQTLNMEYVEINDDANYELNQLKEQFLQKNSNKDSQSSQHAQHQFKQIIEKNNLQNTKFRKSTQTFHRYLEYIRYQAFSHKTTILDKYVLIILVGILILIDNFFLQSILSIMFQILTDGGSFAVNYQLLLYPYPFVIVLSNIFESIWIPSQSYGLIKLYLIFNAMAIFQYILNFLISLVQISLGNFCVLDGFTFASLLIKIILNQLSERLISMNTKLNQLSNKQK